MATFEAQVHALTNIGATLSGTTTPTDAQLDQYLKDGVIDVTNKTIVTSPQDADLFGRESTISDSQGISVGGAKILTVMREGNLDGSSDGTVSWYPCEKVPMNMQSRVVDPDSLYYASLYNPVYTVNSDKTVNVYPIPSSNNGIKIFYINEEPRDISNNAALTHAHSNIKYFPNDKVYLVVIYASIKCLETKMSAMHASIPADSNQTTLSDDWAFVKTAIETEEDLELGAGRAQSLGAEMQQFAAEYQWYQGRAQSLKQEYMGAFNINAPQPQPEGRKR